MRLAESEPTFFSQLPYWLKLCRGARDPVFPNCSTKHAHVTDLYNFAILLFLQKTESRDARPEHVTRTQTGWQDLLKRGRGQNKLCPRHLTPSPTHTTRPHTQVEPFLSSYEFVLRWPVLM